MGEPFRRANTLLRVAPHYAHEKGKTVTNFGDNVSAIPQSAQIGSDKASDLRRLPSQPCRSMAEELVRICAACEVNADKCYYALGKQDPKKGCTESLHR